MDILFYFCTFAVLCIISILLSKKKHTRLFAIGVLAAALMFEIFGANFHSFHLVGGDYQETEIDLNSESVYVSGATGLNAPFTVESSSNGIALIISDIDRPVGTVKIDCELPDSSLASSGVTLLDVEIDAKDETNAATYRNSIADDTVEIGDERSECIIMNLSGNVSALRLRICANAEESFILKGITLNTPVAFHFSAFRLLLIFGIAMAAMALTSFPSMLKSYSEEKNRFKTIIITITTVGALGALLLSMLSNYSNFSLTLPYGNQITGELVDAFRAGQVSLLELPSDELLAMENPYDWSARTAEDVQCLWDHLLFEGKYYSYYGIAPVLLLFLPFNLLTGAYMSSTWAVLLFGILGVMFLSLMFNRFCELFAKKIPLNILISTLIILQISSGIWFCFCTPQFYEIAQASGFMFTTAGFWLLLESGVLGGEKIRYSRIALSVFCQATAVLCRPTLALYCVVSLVALAFGFIRRKKELTDESKKKKRTEYIKYLSSALILYAIIGGIQMIYNYVRFGSFLDFGIQYSLTINDFTRSQYATDFVMIGFYNFLFAVPVIKPEFPFIFSNYSTLGVNGYYFTANRIAVGLPFRALPTLGVFGAGKAFRLLSHEEKLKALLFVLPTCLIIPLVIIFSIWESGYGVRYCCDFAWEMVLGGTAVLYLLYVRAYSDNEAVKKLFRGFFVTAMFAAVAVNFAMIFEYLTVG